MKKFMAFVLTAAMVSSVFGVSALADETTAAEETTVETTAEAPAETTDEVVAEEETADEAVAEEETADEVVAEKETTDEVVAEEEKTDEVVAEAPAAPAADVKKDAVLSNAKVAVNGAEIAPQAYNIGGNTFFKLRDVANALVGTEAGFSVAWDKDARKTVLTTGAEYAATANTDAAAAAKAVAKLSADAVLVNDAEVVLEAYNIDGYNYYKLRELGTALGFEVTWDKEARMIGINSAVLGAEEEVVEKTKATEFTFALAEDEERTVANLIFEEDVTISGDFGMIIFENCEFNGDIINTADMFTKVVLLDGTTVNGSCVFKNATKEANMDYPMPKFISPNAWNVVCEDCIGSFILDGTEKAIVFNGETYTLDDVESFYDADANALVPYEEQEAVEIFVGQWWENGEKVVQLFCD